MTKNLSTEFPAATVKHKAEKAVASGLAKRSTQFDLTFSGHMHDGDEAK